MTDSIQVDDLMKPVLLDMDETVNKYTTFLIGVDDNLCFLYFQKYVLSL